MTPPPANSTPAGKTNKFAFALFLALLAVTIVLLVRRGGEPPVFAPLSRDAALQQVKATGGVLVVRATASWCGPCQQMNRGTWRDPRVEQWFASNGLAVSLDVDAAPQEAQQLHITAVPTLIAYVGGEEFDRAVGYRDADGLLAWLTAVKRGERAGLSESRRPRPDGGSQ